MAIDRDWLCSLFLCNNSVAIAPISKSDRSLGDLCWPELYDGFRSRWVRMIMTMAELMPMLQKLSYVDKLQVIEILTSELTH